MSALEKFGNDKVAVVDAPGKVSLHPKEPKALKPDEVRVEVKYSGICGSDLHTYRGKHPSVKLPATIGHEAVGIVCEVGGNVKHLKVGQRVVVEPLSVCGECEACMRGDYAYCDHMALQYRQGNGFLSKYFHTQARFVYPIPDSIDDVAATVIEVLAIAVRAVRRAKLALGEDVLITGAGTVGLLVAALCGKMGCRNIIIADRVESRLQLAMELGATKAINTLDADIEEEVFKLCPKGVHKSLECIGVEPTLLACLNSLKKGGRATMVGIFEQPQINLFAPIFITREIEMAGCQSYCWDFEPAIDMAEKIDLQCLVTHKFPLSRIQEALEIASSGQEHAIKVVCYPDW